MRKRILIIMAAVMLLFTPAQGKRHSRHRHQAHRVTAQPPQKEKSTASKVNTIASVLFFMTILYLHFQRTEESNL